MASGLSPQLTAQISFSARVIILGLWGSLSKRCDLGFVLRSHGRGRVLSQALSWGPSQQLGEAGPAGPSVQRGN